MKQQNQDLMFDEFLTQILQYRSHAEFLHSLSIFKEDSKYLLKLSKAFDYIFKQFSYLIFQAVNKKVAFDEQLIKNINHILSLTLKILDETFDELEEKEKSDLKSFVRKNCETFSKLQNSQFDIVKVLTKDPKYYVKITNILEDN